MKLVYSHNFKNIPNHALTQYVSDAHATFKTAQKTVKGFAQKPAIQRKTSEAPRPVIASIAPITKPKSVFNVKMPSTKFRQDINKEALAEYFDNDIKDIWLENKLAWQEQAVAEVDAASAAKELEWMVDSSDRNTRESIREFVEKSVFDFEKRGRNISISHRFMPEFDYLCPEPSIDVDYSSLFEDLIEAAEANYIPQDIYPDYYEPVIFFQSPQEGDEFGEDFFAERVTESSSEQVGINSIDATEEDKFERQFFANEINAHIFDVFEKKMRQTPQVRSMRKRAPGQLRRDFRKVLYTEFMKQR